MNQANGREKQEGKAKKKIGLYEQQIDRLTYNYEKYCVCCGQKIITVKRNDSVNLD